MTAIKPVYNRSTKSYDLDVVGNADPLFAHSGFLVYDDAARCLECVERGTIVGHWDEKKIAVVKAHLLAAIAAA